MAANYPTANPSFTVKSNGETVQASHIDDLQDEVTAIGTALRGSLQHAVTVATGGLTVSTGNTTLGQNLTVAGTFSLLNQPACGLVSTAAQTITDLTWTAVTFTAQEVNIGSLHSTTTNPSRVSFGSTGYWDVEGRVVYNSNSTGYRAARLVVDSTVQAGAADYRGAFTGAVITPSVRALIYVTASTSFVELFTQQNTGASTTASVAGNTASRYLQNTLTVRKVG